MARIANTNEMLQASTVRIVFNGVYDKGLHRTLYPIFSRHKERLPEDCDTKGYYSTRSESSVRKYQYEIREPDKNLPSLGKKQEAKRKQDTKKKQKAKKGLESKGSVAKNSVIESAAIESSAIESSATKSSVSKDSVSKNWKSTVEQLNIKLVHFADDLDKVMAAHHFHYDALEALLTRHEVDLDAESMHGLWITLSWLQKQDEGIVSSFEAVRSWVRESLVE